MDKTTDVLSFPQLDANDLRRARSKLSQGRGSSSSGVYTHVSGLPLGDIVINLHKAKRQAEEYGVGLNDEVNRLLIHGLVHLIGYDHEKSRYQRIRMEAKERELFDSLK